MDFFSKDILSQISGLADSIELALKDDKSEILVKFPIDTFIHYTQVFPEFSSYKVFDHKALEFYSTLNGAGFSSNTLANYYKLFLLRFISSSYTKLFESNMPVSIVNHYLAHFNKLLQKINTNNISGNWFDFNNEKFCKELGIISLRVIPVGPQFVALRRLSLRPLLHGGIKKLVCRVFGNFRQYIGSITVYELHMNQIDPVMMAAFNPKGWEQMFCDLADLLAVNKSVKGIVGIAWFFDPKVKQISPEIGYIYDLSIRIGATAAKLKPGPNALKDSTFMNPHRKRLYEEGKYLPVSYMVFFPRNKIIEWSYQQNNS